MENNAEMLERFGFTKTDGGSYEYNKPSPDEAEENTSADKDMLRRFGIDENGQYQGGPLEEETEIDPYIMVNSQDTSPIAKGKGAERMLQHFGYGVAQTIGEGIEAPFTLVGGAIDEVASLTGMYDEPGYHIRDYLDEVMQFDEAFRSVYEPEGGTLTAGEAAAQAAGRGTAGAATAFFGGPSSQAGNFNKFTNQIVKPGEQLAHTASQLKDGMAFAGLQSTGAYLGFSFGGNDLTSNREASAIYEAVFPIVSMVSRRGLKTTGSAAVKMVQKAPIVGPVLTKTIKHVQTTKDVFANIIQRSDFQDLSWKEKFKVLKDWRSYADLQGLEPVLRAEVLSHMEKLFNAADPELIGKRLKIIDELQKIDPNFQPGFGTILGTPEGRAYEQVVGLHNPELAQMKYDSTIKAIKNIKKHIAKNPDYLHGKGFELLLNEAKETSEVLHQGLAHHIDNANTMLTQELINPGYLPAEEAAVLRESLKTLKKSYNDVSASLFELAIPEGADKIMIDSKDLIAKVRSFSNKNHELYISENADNFLGSGIQSLVSRLQSKHKKPKVDMINMTSNPNGGVSNELSFDNLRELEKRLGSEEEALRHINPHSSHLSKYTSLRKEVGEMLDNYLLDNNKELYDLRYEAKEFYKNEYLPRFRNSKAAGMIQYKNGDPLLLDDSVMSTYWRPGDNVAGPQELKTVFTRTPDPSNTYFGPKDLEMMENESERVHESLSRYALYTFEKKIRDVDLTSKDAEEILNKWKKEYSGALKQYPSIAKNFESVEDAMKAVSANRRQLIESREETNKMIIKELTGTDYQDALKKLTSSDYQANRFLSEVDKIYADQPAKAEQLKKSLNDTLMNHILNKSMNTKTGNYDYNKVSDMMFDRRHVIRRLIGEEDYKNLDNFLGGLQITKDSPPLNVTVDINQLNKMLEAIGISPASAIARLYSFNIGMVGAPYLVTEAASRFALKRAEKHFNEIFKELMYDPKVLVDLNDLVEKARLAGDITKSSNRVKDAWSEKTLEDIDTKLHTLLPMLGLDVSRSYDEYHNLRQDFSEQAVLAEEAKASIEENAKAREDKDIQENGLDMYEADVDSTDIGEGIGSETMQAPVDGDDDSVEDIIESPKDMDSLDAIDKAVDLTDYHDADLLRRFAFLESGLKADAKSNVAKGLFQFTNSTWKEEVRKNGKQFGLTTKNADVMNPLHASLMAATRVKDYASILDKKGIPENPQNMYMLHLLGKTGGVRFLKAYAKDPSQPASAGVGSAAIKNNPGVFKKKFGNRWGDELTLSEVMLRLEQRAMKADRHIDFKLGSRTEEPVVEDKPVVEETVSRQVPVTTDPFSTDNYQFTEQDMLVGAAAHTVNNFRDSQMRLSQEPVSRTVKLDTLTGEQQWQ